MTPAGTALPRAAGGWLAEHWRLVPVLAAFPLFVVGAAYHVALGVMVVLGFIVLIRMEGDRLLADSGVRLILVIFAAIWIPQLIALPGAAEQLFSLRAVGRFLLYPLAALHIAFALRTPGRWEHLALGIGAVVTFWTIDHLLGPAGIDLTSIHHPFLYPGGIVFREHTIAHVTAAASPLLFELVRRRHRADPRIWLILVPLVLLVLISGRRVAWMMLVVAAVGYLILHIRRVRWTLVAAGLAVALAGGALVYSQHDLTRDRVQVTLGLLGEDREARDLATNNRLDIWATSARTARANWPFGVGTLGARFVYADYAAPGDFWVREGYPRQHPHQFMLELAADTGLAGLLGYLVMLIAVARALARAPSGWARASGVGLLVAIFPLNAHVSFYGSMWSMVVWWLVGLMAAGMVTREEADADAKDAGGLSLLGRRPAMARDSSLRSE